MAMQHMRQALGRVSCDVRFLVTPPPKTAGFLVAPLYGTSEIVHKWYSL